MRTDRFQKYKWMTLMAFSVMYVFVYIGRFNVSALMPDISAEIGITPEQQRIITISVFFSYAIGSMINGRLSDRLGGKKVVLAGGAVSIFANLAIAFAGSWQLVLVLEIVNGFFQSMIWVGGIEMLSHWWKPGERGKGVGIANLFSGLSHVTAYVVPLIFVMLMPYISWRGKLTYPILVWGAAYVLFAVFAVGRPEKKGLQPYTIAKEDKRRELRAKKLEATRGGVFMFFRGNRAFYVWCIIAMLSSVCRYGLLNWIPKYFDKEMGGTLISEAFSNLMLPTGMALGTLLITWIGGSHFNKNKGLVIIWAAALCGTLTIVFPMVGISRVVLMGIFFAGFFLYGINGMLWLYAIDAGCRYFSGTIAGFLNGFAYLGATMEAFVFPAVIKMTHSMLSVFIVMELLCVAMILCGMAISRKNTLVEPEVRE